MAGGGINSSNPLGPQQGQSTPPTGGTGQMPSFANNPFGPPQQPNAGSQFNAARNPGAAANQFKVPDWVQEPEPGTMTSSALVELTNPATGEKFMAPSGGYSVREQQQPFAPVGSGRGSEITSNPFAPLSEEQRRAHFGMFGHPQPISDMQYRREQFIQRQPPQPMQQPGRPAFMQSPEYQGYQTQMQGLQQQMNDYMQKAPMYQQLQDLQGKMQGYHDNYARQQQQQMMQRPSPFRRGQFQQPMGLMGLMGGRGGMGMASPGSYEQYANTNNQALARASQEVKRPTMSRADFDARNIMSMDMPQARGFESDYRAFMKNGGKV